MLHRNRAVSLSFLPRGRRRGFIAATSNIPSLETVAARRRHRRPIYMSNKTTARHIHENCVRQHAQRKLQEEADLQMPPVPSHEGLVLTPISSLRCFFITHGLHPWPKQPQMLSLSVCNTTEVGQCGKQRKLYTKNTDCNTSKISSLLLGLSATSALEATNFKSAQDCPENFKLSLTL